MSEVSVFHFHFEKSVPSSLQKAAEWAWTCLENLCSSFCKNCCQKETKCNLKYHLKVNNEISYKDAQKAFHQALSYLTAIEPVDDECQACLVTKALETFPLIASRSAVSPVSEIKMNAVDCYPDVVPMGLNSNMSFPCCVIKTWIGDSEHTNENRCREMVLLNLNVDEFPVMPPWEYKLIENDFLPGQKVVKKIWATKQAESVEEIEKTELFRQNLTNAIAATVCLRDLIRIKCFYPDAVPEGDFELLKNSLTEGIDFSVNKEPFLRVISDELYKAKTSETASLLDSLSVFYSVMLLHHPEMPSVDHDTEKTKDSVSEILDKCIEESFQPIKDARDYIINAKLRSCIYPTPKDQQAYRSTSRYFMMFKEYWLLCQKAITDRTNHHLAWHPYSLSKLVINLKHRIDVCIDGITETGFEIDLEIRSDLEYLIEALLHWNVDEISVGVEDILIKLQNIALWIEETNLKLGRSLTGMLSEEQTFIEYACQVISDYDRKVKTSFKKMLNNKDKQAAELKNNAPNKPQNEKSTISFPLPDGARWEDISITFSDGHVITVKHQGTRKRFTYSQMGMVCSKSGNPTKQWELLKTFADSYGQIDWHSKYATYKLKKQKQELSKRLRQFFRLEDDPIKWARGEKAYRCRFIILPENSDDY